MLGFLLSPPTLPTVMIKTKAYEYGRKCDLATHKHDEASAERFAMIAYQESGLDTQREVTEHLGPNVAYYIFEHGWGGQ